MICPIHGAVPGLKLACEQCTRDRSNQAMEAMQKHYAQTIATDAMPMTVIEMFPKGTLDPRRWHIQRFGDRRHTLCGAFIRSPGGMRQIRFSCLEELKPFCTVCDEKLRGLIEASATTNAAVS
jgi:hypothetical protein